jgi:hypothetical protein
VEFSDSNSSVAATSAGWGVAVAGGLTLANPIPTNPYKKQVSNSNEQHATTAELLSYFDKVMSDNSAKESYKASKKAVSSKKPSSRKAKEKATSNSSSTECSSRVDNSQFQ